MARITDVDELKDKISKLAVTSNPAVTSDPVGTSDLVGTSDPLGTSDPFGTSDPVGTSDLFGTSDPLGTCDPFGDSFDYMFGRRGRLGTSEMVEAMLYYLYMMSDGEVSYSEEKLFKEICKELSINEEDRQSAIAKCREIAKDPKDALYIILSEKLDEQVGKGWFGLKDKSTLARIIWNLVNLGYADANYSEEEKKIVNHLIGKWEIDEEVYQEMVDTADTILALTKQKDWIMSTFSRGSERDEKEKRIDDEINTMLSDIKISIEELTI